MKPILLNIMTNPAGTTVVMTNMPQPQPGAALNPAESRALAAIAGVRHEDPATTVRWGFNPLAELSRDLMHPEQHGHAVAGEIRRA